MEQIAAFIKSLEQKGKSDEVLLLAPQVLGEFEQAKVGAEDLLAFTRSFCENHLVGDPEAVNKIIILFWYHDFLGQKECSAYLITLLGTLDVIESQERRMRQLYKDDITGTVFADLHFPSLGSDLSRYPDAINNYLKRMRSNLSEEQCQNVLAGNHHNIDPTVFVEEKKRFERCPDLATFLQVKHQRLISNLDEHARTGKLWYEQYITPQVVKYVEEHQEVQTGIIDGGRIIIRKIPYNPDAWLNEKDPQIKRYNACHCPFVRAAIKSGTEVTDLWCYCSGGYCKLFFDYLFDTDTQVEMLASVLSGSDTCDFAVHLPPQLF